MAPSGQVRPSNAALDTSYSTRPKFPLINS
jgi:hypothetical protein